MTGFLGLIKMTKVVSGKEGEGWVWTVELSSAPLASAEEARERVEAVFERIFHALGSDQDV